MRVHFLDDIISSWLRKDDDVTETSGHPSWQSLNKAMEEAGYSGIAAMIRKGQYNTCTYCCIPYRR